METFTAFWWHINPEKVWLWTRFKNLFHLTIFCNSQQKLRTKISYDWREADLWLSDLCYY